MLSSQPTSSLILGGFAAAVACACLLEVSSGQAQVAAPPPEEPGPGSADSVDAGAPSADAEAPAERGAATSADAGAPALFDPTAAGTYFVQRVTESEAGPVSHLAAVSADSFDALAGFDASVAGIAVAGDSPATAFGSSVFLASTDAPTLARFDVGVGGQLTAGPVLDFGPQGVEAVFYWRVVVASPTKAYLFDSENERALAWDPQTMASTGASIDLSAGLKAGFTLDPLAYYGRSVGDTLFVPASWFSDEDFASLPTAALYAIDTSTDTLLAFTEDTRCPGYVLETVPSGDLYVLPDQLFAEELGLGTERPACALRVAAGASAFDAAFSADLAELLALAGAPGPRFVQGGIGDGSGGIFLGAAAPADGVSGGAAGDAGAPEAPAYDLFLWNVEPSAATPVPGVRVLGGLIGQSNGEAPRFALQPVPDAEATLVRAMSGATTAVALAGQVVSFARVR